MPKNFTRPSSAKCWATETDCSHVCCRSQVERYGNRIISTISVSHKCAWHQNHRNRYTLRLWFFDVTFAPFELGQARKRGSADVSTIRILKGFSVSSSISLTPKRTQLQSASHLFSCKLDSWSRVWGVWRLGFTRPGAKEKTRCDADVMQKMNHRIGCPRVVSANIHASFANPCDTALFEKQEEN